MKRIVGIDEAIKGLDGTVLKVPEKDKEGEPTDVLRPFTVKDALVNLIGSAVSETDPKGLTAGEQAMIISDLGRSLASAEKDWEYDESDNVDTILKRTINENKINNGQGRYPAYILGIVYEKVKHAVAFKKS